MVKSFDIGPSRPKKRKKNNSIKPKRGSSSWLSWIFLLIVIIIASSFLTSKNTNENEPPQSSIDNEILAQKVENEEKSKTTPQVNSEQESPNTPNKDLQNSLSEIKQEDIEKKTENIENNTLESINKLELKIKILNGTGEAKQAAKAKNELEKKGYIIAIIDTAKNIYNTSHIYYADSHFESSKKIQQDLNINAKLEQNKNITTNFDLVIVLGKNYTK